MRNKLSSDKMNKMLKFLISQQEKLNGEIETLELNSMNNKELQAEQQAKIEERKKILRLHENAIKTFIKEIDNQNNQIEQQDQRRQLGFADLDFIDHLFTTIFYTIIDDHFRHNPGTSTTTFIASAALLCASWGIPLAHFLQTKALSQWISHQFPEISHIHIAKLSKDIPAFLSKSVMGKDVYTDMVGRFFTQFMLWKALNIGTILATGKKPIFDLLNKQGDEGIFAFLLCYATGIGISYLGQSALITSPVININGMNLPNPVHYLMSPEYNAGAAFVFDEATGAWKSGMIGFNGLDLAFVGLKTTFYFYHLLTENGNTPSDADVKLLEKFNEKLKKLKEPCDEQQSENYIALENEIVDAFKEKLGIEKAKTLARKVIDDHKEQKTSLIKLQKKMREDLKAKGGIESDMTFKGTGTGTDAGAGAGAGEQKEYEGDENAGKKYTQEIFNGVNQTTAQSAQPGTDNQSSTEFGVIDISKLSASTQEYIRSAIDKKGVKHSVSVVQRVRWHLEKLQQSSNDINDEDRQIINIMNKLTDVFTGEGKLDSFLNQRPKIQSKEDLNNYIATVRASIEKAQNKIKDLTPRNHELITKIIHDTQICLDKLDEKLETIKKQGYTAENLDNVKKLYETMQTQSSYGGYTLGDCLNNIHNGALTLAMAPIKKEGGLTNDEISKVFSDAKTETIKRTSSTVSTSTAAHTEFRLELDDFVLTKTDDEKEIIEDVKEIQSLLQTIKKLQNTGSDDGEKENLTENINKHLKKRKKRVSDCDFSELSELKNFIANNTPTHQRPPSTIETSGHNSGVKQDDSGLTLSGRIITNSALLISQTIGGAVGIAFLPVNILAAFTPLAFFSDGIDRFEAWVLDILMPTEYLKSFIKRNRSSSNQTSPVSKTGLTKQLFGSGDGKLKYLSVKFLNNKLKASATAVFHKFGWGSSNDSDPSSNSNAFTEDNRKELLLSLKKINNKKAHSIEDVNIITNHIKNILSPDTTIETRGVFKNKQLIKVLIEIETFLKNDIKTYDLHGRYILRSLENKLFLGTKKRPIWTWINVAGGIIFCILSSPFLLNLHARKRAELSLKLNVLRPLAAAAVYLTKVIPDAIYPFMRAIGYSLKSPFLAPGAALDVFSSIRFIPVILALGVDLGIGLFGSVQFLIIGGLMSMLGGSKSYDFSKSVMTRCLKSNLTSSLVKITALFNSPYYFTRRLAESYQWFDKNGGFTSLWNKYVAKRADPAKPTWWVEPHQNSNKKSNAALYATAENSFKLHKLDTFFPALRRCWDSLYQLASDFITAECNHDDLDRVTENLKETHKQPNAPKTPPHVVDGSGASNHRDGSIVDGANAVNNPVTENHIQQNNLTGITAEAPAKPASDNLNETFNEQVKEISELVDETNKQEQNRHNRVVYNNDKEGCKESDPPIAGQNDPSQLKETSIEVENAVDQVVARVTTLENLLNEQHDQPLLLQLDGGCS